MKMIIVRLDCTLKLVSNGIMKFVENVIQITLKHFCVKARVTIFYKSNANKLAESTNYTLCMMLAKHADMDGSK